MYTIRTGVSVMSRWADDCARLPRGRLTTTLGPGSEEEIFRIQFFKTNFS